MADSRGEYWYFDSHVDANKITVPELRSILLKHGVQYPSSAKKPTLVSLFYEQVAPQAGQIQRAHARTKRSTRGIEDVPSSASTTTDDAEDDTLVAPPASTRRSSRRTTRASTEETESRAPAPRGKTPSRAVPAKHAREPEPELEERPPTRRTRKSATPAVQREPSAPPADDSPFTQDNPFQSGSSPTGPDASRDRRRRTMGFEQKEKRKSDAYRRRTVQPNAEQHHQDIVVPSRQNFEAPVARGSRRRSEPVEESNSADTGEEFAPEEQLELVRERAKTGQTDILPPRRRKQTTRATGTLKAFAMTLLATTTAVVGGVWRQEKYAVGFCGIGRHSTSLAGVDMPEWANDLLPQCEPCPPHATCYQNLQVQCERDFVKKDHPLSLAGLIPLPPSCEPDGEKTRRVALVADTAVKILRKRKAQYECAEPDAEGKPVDSPEVSKQDLLEELSANKQKSMSQDQFDELFERAFGEMTLRDEIVESNDGAGQPRVATTSLAELSLSCSIRRSVRQSLERHLFHIVMIVFIVATGAYGRYSFSRSRTMEARAKQLASSVFDRLADTAALNYQEPSAYPDRGLSMAQLRDDVLRSEFSAKRRKQLWDRVQKKVELNSNVRAAVKSTHSGDVARVWEWIGPLHLIEDGRSSSRRESGRYSAGFGSSPPTAPKEMKETKSWDEGHPIY